MGDEMCTEEELLAHAIALSLANQTESGPLPEEAACQTRETPSSGLLPEAPKRSNTTQSCDSALMNEAEDSLCGSLRLQNQKSGGKTSSSSPDLGISPEPDLIDPQSGTLSVRRGDRDFEKSSRESLLSSPEPKRARSPGIKNITLDGGSNQRQNPVGEENPHLLPYTRLSSLHDMNLGRGILPATAKRWEPDREALELIIGMGISENAAKRSLYNTGNKGAEVAIEWVFENISNVELHEPFTPPVHMPTTATPPGGVAGPLGIVGTSGIFHSYDNVAEGMLLEADQGAASFKMVFVANSSLKMGVGKIGSQVGHAVLSLYHFVSSQQDRKLEVDQWERFGAKKIVLKGDDTQHLLDLKQKAVEIGLPNILVHDAGRTQIDPGSLTILALFGRSQEVDSVTGKLKLL